MYHQFFTVDFTLCNAHICGEIHSEKMLLHLNIHQQSSLMAHTVHLQHDGVEEWSGSPAEFAPYPAVADCYLQLTPTVSGWDRSYLNG